MAEHRIQIVGAGEIRALERLGYETAVPLQSTHDIFLRAARLFPERPALTQLYSGDIGDAPRVITYSALLAGIHRAANLFRSRGVGPQDAVALLLPSVPEAHFALWGAQIAGRACPVNYMLDVDHIVELLRAAGVKVLVALGPDPDFDIWGKAEQLRARLPELKLLQAGGAADSEDGFERLMQEQPAELAFERAIAPADIAAYYHTGGTTGAPKLAQHAHANEVHTSWFAGMFYGLTERDIMINGFPLFHVAGAFVYGAGCFCAGANIVLPPRLGMRDRRFVASYWRFVERYRVTYLAAVPTIIAALLDTPVDGADISLVRALYTGGSPLPSELAAAFEKKLGIPVRNILGMTESAGLVAIEPLAAPRIALSCGLPLPFSEVFAVRAGPEGPQLDSRCAANEPGVIVMRGPNVSPGYTDPGANSGMFAPRGLLVSGDLGHIDADGRVYLTGRAKDVIIRGAHNIDPSMIEEAFAAHPAVQSCAAVGEPDAYAGELPVIFLTLRPGVQASAAEILAEVAPGIGERAAVPRRVTVLDAMPMTAIGKIFKPALRQRAIEQAYGEVLQALAGSCRSITVKARQAAGGLAAEIRIAGAADPAAIELRVKELLARFVVPFEVEYE
ncbi:MAG: AMP-binding protein [Proteobacteria bacterium]|nr:AMP-binding protein [Pseudomonadota bacterium]